MCNLELKIDEKFNKYLVEKGKVSDMFRGLPGIKYRFIFPNNYGASVIKFHGSYGYEHDLWELGLLEVHSDGSVHLAYTELTGYDVLGYLTDSEVNEIMQLIIEGKVDEYPEDIVD